MFSDFLQNVVVPRTIYTVDSPISGRISVLKRGSNIRLVSGGLTQSVYVLNNNWNRFPRSYWVKAAELIKDLLSVPSQGLILGLGGGTFAHVITHTLGEFPLIGVEYDPEIIKIGKQYFNLDTLKHLQIVEKDAFSYIDECSDSTVKFSFVFCDLFTGRSVVSGIEEEQFLVEIRSLLENEGVALFNWSHSYSSATDRVRRKQMLARMEKIFSNVETQVVHSGNCMLIWGRR